MGIYIKGTEMPTSCFYCPFREKVNPDDYVCMALNKEFEETFSLIVGKRHKDCPLVPVPDHGRLIDADALEYRADNVRDPMGRTEKTVMWRYIQNAPTVVPSEQGSET